MIDNVNTGKKLNFVSRQVEQTAKLLDAFNELLELRSEWDALGYGSSITQNDLIGTLAYLTPAMLADAFSSIDALKAVMDAGHKTNLYRLIP